MNELGPLVKLRFAALGLIVSIAGIAMIVFGGDAEPLPSPAPQVPEILPFWNIGTVSGLAVDDWPASDGAAIPISPELALIPIRRIGDAGVGIVPGLGAGDEASYDGSDLREPGEGDGLGADARLYLRAGSRVLEGSYVAASLRCELALAYFPRGGLKPFPLADDGARGVQTARLLLSRMPFRGEATVREAGSLCHVLPMADEDGDVSFRMWRCTVSTGGYTDGVALLDKSGRLAAVLMERGDGGYAVSGPDVESVRQFLRENRRLDGPTVRSTPK